MAIAKQNSGNTANYVTQMWSKFMPYWPVFIIILILSLGRAWWQLSKTNPRYLTSTAILIKEKKKGADETKVIQSLNPLLAPENDVENEMAILKSISLMTDVVKNLHLYAMIFEKGKFIDHSAYKTSPVSIMVKNPDSLQYSDEIHFSFIKESLQVNLEGAIYPLNTWVNTKYGTLQFVPNKHYSSSSGNSLFFFLIPPKYLAALLAGSLNAAPINKASAVIKLTFVDEVPERAESMLKELIVVYNKAAFDEKAKLAEHTLSFVEDRLRFVAHELDSIEYKVQQYKAKKGGMEISAKGQMYFQNVTEADQKIGQVNMQLQTLNQVENYVVSKENSGALVPSTVGIADGTFTQLLSSLYLKELEYETLKRTTGENNPVAVRVYDQINKIKPAILENIGEYRKNLELTKNNLQSTSGLNSSMLQTIPRAERELIDINRDHAIKNSLYTFLLQKREETALAAASGVSDSRVVDEPATSRIPISPKPKQTYLFAIVLGFILAIALISAKEMFTRTILFRHEIESLTSLPVISEIGFDKSKNPLITAEGKNTFIAAQFRKLRASLTFLGIDSKRKKILITSTISGEGKSFVAANLGISLALTGKKVILLEFDLSNPSLSKKFNINANKGLTNYIMGEREPEEIIKRTKANENLFIIPSGPIPENPSEMILDSKVEELLVYLNGIFDYIIIDTAPVGPMTDAYILSSYCDATLYIIRHKYTPKRFVQRIDEEIKINHLNNAAIVFNGIRSRGFTKNTYGYGYGYGYEYLYQEKQNKRKEFNS